MQLFGQRLGRFSVKTLLTGLLGLAFTLPAVASDTPNLDAIKERGTLRVGISPVCLGQCAISRVS